MAKKAFCLMLALAMIASQARASLYMDAFYGFTQAPSLATLVNMVVYQVLNLVEPLLVGFITVAANWLYNDFTIDIVMGTDTITFTGKVLLGTLGIGNEEVLSNALVQYLHYTIVTMA